MYRRMSQKVSELIAQHAIISSFNTPERIQKIEAFEAIVRIVSVDGRGDLMIEMSEPIVMEARIFDKINNVFAQLDSDGAYTPAYISRICTKTLRTLLTYGLVRFEEENQEELSIFVDDDEVLRYEDHVFEIVERQHVQRD